MRGLWAIEARASQDPMLRVEQEQVHYDYGDVFQSMGEIRVLGALGAVGAPLAAPASSIDAEWTDSSQPVRARSVLRYSSARERARSADMRPALALDPDLRTLWFSEWGDIEERRDAMWNALLTVDEQPDSAAIWLENSVARVESMHRPFPADYFITGVLAQRLGEDETAVRLFGQIGQCPLDVTSLDVGWGLSTVARLYRARSLELLGRRDEAASDYAVVARNWAAGGPEVARFVAEAEAALLRLSSSE
jgi:hypothetical protein